MMAGGLGNMTQEQRKAAQEKGRLARLAKAAARVGNPLGLKLEYADENHWDELARKHGVNRMPGREDQVDETLIRKWCHKLDIPLEVFYEHYTSPKYFVAHNPTWTKYAAAGLLLELKDSLQMEAA